MHRNWLITIAVIGITLIKFLDAQGCATISIQNGRTRYRQKGRFVKFQCNPGYNLAGEKYSTCRNGDWEGPIPRCVRATCSKARPPLNGLIYPSHRGAVLNFFCKPGYVLKGHNTTYCDGKQWDSNLPSCVSANGTVPLSCDFEQEDICGWSHDLRHDFDWIRMNFNTPSGHIGTGPSYDHTKGEGSNGYYMYIESTSRNENDTARLISPIFDKIDNVTCLEFYYHMYGAAMGQLKVYMKKLSDSWQLNESNLIFSKSGNQGDVWLRSFISLGVIEEDFQIIFEGIRGKSYVSDIAIDDVRLIPNCNFDEEATTSSTSEFELSSSSSSSMAPLGTCTNRCMDTIDPQESCQCDNVCVMSNTCCPDYVALCVLGTDESVSTTTGEEIEWTTTDITTQTSEKLLSSSKPTTRIPEIIRKPVIVQDYSPDPILVRKILVTTARSTTSTTTSTTSRPKTTSTTQKTTSTTKKAQLIQKPHSKVPQEENHRSIITVLIVMIILIVLSMIIISRTRYCKRIRVMGQVGDSQSDVRFLTHDEHLDFTLLHPNDYDL